MKRKILSLILVFAMTVSLLTVGTGAVEPTYGDTAGHWAESSIERWSAYGIIQGSNGQFDPNGQLTCAQLATILAKLLKLPAAKDAGFTDNTADAWYYDAINRCAAAGILNGNGDGTVTPEAPITRERAMVMLARALGIEPIRKPDLTKYTDAAQVSAYAQGYVAALIEAGIVGGVTADELAPQANINRASTVTILDRAISTYADKAGATVKADGKGLVLVVAENVKITNAPEGTKIVVADGATGLTVNGKSVSDDQTYIVPKTTTGSGSSSGGGHSHSYVYTDNGDGTHTGKCYANDSALSPEAHNHNGENGKCTVCGAAQTAASVASVKAADGTYTYYTTLAAALAAAKNGDTVKLVQDITPTDRIEVTGDKNITIDLAEKKITSTADVAIVNNGTGKLTITGNGTVDTSSSTNGEDIAIWARTGSIDIENGTFINKSNKEATVYAGTSADASTPVITIKGGTFENKATGPYEYKNSLKPLTLNVQNDKPVTSIVITGGTFYGNDPKNGDDNKGGTFLAEGYKAVENGDGTWVVRKKENNAQVGGKNYEELSDAIEASNSIDNTITLTKNTTVKLENGVANGSEKSRNITIKGDGTQTVDVITRAISAEGGMLSYQRGSTFTFKNVTIQAGEGNFDGIVCDELVYNNCIIKGKLTLYGKATFINCTFENEMANQYSIWTWGGTDVRFEDCTFNTNGKAILLYGQATAEKPTNLTVSNCTFNDRNNGSAGKAAIEIGNDYNATYSLTVTSATVNGFADGKNTGSKIWANKNSMDAEHLTVIIDNKYVLGTETPKQTVTVATAEELKEKLTMLTSAGSGNNVINIDGDFQLANGETWTPVTVDGYNGAGVITINGNGHTIKGLNAPLIAGGFAGKSGVVIKDLTLENVTINDTTSNQGIGAFIGNVDSMPQIDLDNCHLINSNITSTDGARVGGLIGWTSGYNNPNDGPVNTCVSITNCSVENCAITAKGSVGAIIGHAGANPATYQTITGCTVKDCTLTSTDDGGWRVGVVVGTANVGEVTIKNITTDNNTVTQTGKTAPEGQSDLYGRFVPGETGKLTIDNIEIK